MMNLLNACNFSQNDVLVSVGDMVDRGPKSWEVAKFFRETKNAFSVLGNHERRLSGVIKGTSQPAWSQLHTLSKIEDQEKLQWSIWLDSLQAVIEIGHAIITHARLDPNTKLKEQDPYFTSAVGGENVKIEIDENGIPIWYKEFSHLHNLTKPICMGHISYSRIELVSERLFALDTKAVHGGKLTAIVFPNREIISVKVKINYYEESYKKWSELLLTKVNASAVKINKIEKILMKKEINAIEEKVKADFLKIFNELDLVNRSRRIRSNCESIYGAIPSNGRERGEYFLALNDKISDTNERKLIKKVLTIDKYDLRLFFTLFPTLSLSEINNVIGQIEKTLLIY